MADWKWDGVSKDGKAVSGVENVKSELELKRILRARGIRPKKMLGPSPFDIDIGLWLVEKGFASPFGPAELLSFTKNLSVMTGAGVPILQTLQILFKQEKNPSLKMSIKKIATDVSSGKSLSESMSNQKGFSRLYCNLINAGEVGGALDAILVKLIEYLEKNEKIKTQIKQAMTYPTIVMFVGVIVIYGMLAFVVPKLTEMVKESGQQLPAVTQFVIDVSDWLQHWSPVLIPGIFIGIIFFSQWVKTPIGKAQSEQILMSMPLFGPIVIKGNLSAFSRTLSTMLSSGVSLIDSLEICTNTTDSPILSKDIKKIKKSVEEGKTLAEPFGEINYFPEIVAQMVKIGEQTGNLEQMMNKVADLFEKEVEESIAMATKLIEPIILVVLGGFVALILVAIYLPMFTSAGGGG